MTDLPQITVYSRPGCHLCEVLLESLLPRVRGRAAIDVIDIDSRPEYQEDYGLRIPVVELDGQFVCQYTLDTDALTAALGPFPDDPA